MAVPGNWLRPSSDEVDAALEQVRRVLAAEGASELLAEYYDPKSAYAGDLYLGVEPNNPGEITAADLYAVSILNVQIGVSGCRSLLMNPVNTAETQRLLDLLPVDLDLVEASVEQLATASTLHQHVRTCLGKNPWVVAAKMTARKRPRLFPVRDNVVRWTCWAWAVTSRSTGRSTRPSWLLPRCARCSSLSWAEQSGGWVGRSRTHHCDCWMRFSGPAPLPTAARAEPGRIVVVHLVASG